MIDILKGVKETRKIASVLYDLLLGIEGADINTVLTEAMVEEVNAGTRLVVGQAILLVTRDGAGAVLTSIPAIVTNVERFTNPSANDVVYYVKTLLGKLDSQDDISLPIIITGETLAEKVETVIEKPIIDFIKANTIGESTAEFKILLGVPHIFYKDTVKFNSFF